MGIVHGNQLILPAIIKDGETLAFHNELAVALAEMARRKKPDDEWIYFTRLLWPILFVQGEASNHLVIDDLSIAGLKMQITNPPRTAEVGHILRDSSLQKDEKLENILNTISYTDEVVSRAPEETEKLSIQIPGLVAPELSAALAKIVRQAQPLPVDNSAVLDSLFTTEQALNLSGEYRKILDLTRGNAVRWKSLVQLIKEPVERWKVDMNVQLKDAQDRFSSDISKTDRLIDDDYIQNRINQEKDQLEMWGLRQKKIVLKKMVEVLRPLDLIFGELHESGQNLLTAGTIVSMKEREIVAGTEKQLDRIEVVYPNIQNQLETAKQSYESYLTELREIELKAEQRIDQVKLELEDQLKNKELTIEEIQKQRQEAVDSIKENIELLETKYVRIMEVIAEHAAQCKAETEALMEWVVSDRQTDLSQPVVRMFLPVYAAMFEDEDMEERFEFIFPSVASAEGGNLVLSHVDPAFTKFTKEVQEALEDDVKKRSNFEFSCEERNLFQVAGLGAKISLGEKFLQGFAPEGARGMISAWDEYSKQ